jgi:hypothetical protein
MLLRLNYAVVNIFAELAGGRGIPADNNGSNIINIQRASNEFYIDSEGGPQRL